MTDSRDNLLACQPPIAVARVTRARGLGVAVIGWSIIGWLAVGCGSGEGEGEDSKTEAKPAVGGVLLAPIAPPESPQLWPLHKGWKLVVTRDRGPGQGVGSVALDTDHVDGPVRVMPFAGEQTRFTLTLHDDSGALRARAVTTLAIVDQAGADRQMNAFLAPAGVGAKVVSMVDATGKLVADSGRLGEAVAVASGGDVFFSGGGSYKGGQPCEKVSTGSPVAEVMRLDPATNTRVKLATMGVPRSFHTATAIGGGRIVLAGGYSSATAATTGTVDLLRTNQGTVKAAPVSMSKARARHCAVARQGRVAFVGGDGPGAAFIEWWDPGTGTVAEVNLSQPRRDAHCALLTDPVDEKVQLWVIGGALTGGGSVPATFARIEVFTIDGSTVSPMGYLDMPAGQMSLGAIATPLSPRGLLIAGGFGPTGAGQPLDTVWWHSLPGTAWSAGGKLSAARGCPAVARTGDRVFIAGGMGNSGEPLDTMEVVDVAAAKPTSVAVRKLPAARAGSRATTLNNAAVLLSGGVEMAKGVLVPAKTLLWMWP